MDQRGDRRGGLYRQVALDESGLAHTAISDKEKLELGDLSLCHGKNTENVPEAKEQQEAGGQRKAGPKQRTARSQQQEAHVRSKPPPHVLENIVHKATTTPQSPRLFHFRPPPTQLLSTPKMSPPSASGHTTMARVGELLAGSNRSVNGRRLHFRWRPCNPQLVTTTPASRFPEQRQRNQLGRMVGECWQIEDPQSSSSCTFRMPPPRKAFSRPQQLAWNPKLEQTVPRSSRKFPRQLRPRDANFKAKRLANGQLSIPDLRLMHVLQPRELHDNPAGPLLLDLAPARFRRPSRACCRSREQQDVLQSADRPPQNAREILSTGPRSPRPPDEGLLERPVKLTKGTHEARLNVARPRRPGTPAEVG